MGWMKDIEMSYGSFENYEKAMDYNIRTQKRRGEPIASTDKIFIELVKASKFHGKYIYDETTKVFSRKNNYEVGDVVFATINGDTDYYCVQQIEIIKEEDNNDVYYEDLPYLENCITFQRFKRGLSVDFEYDRSNKAYTATIYDSDDDYGKMTIEDGDYVELPAYYKGKTIIGFEITTPLQCTKIKIPEGVEFFSPYPCCLSRLEEISFPSSLQEICASAFFGALRLKKIHINNGCHFFGDDCFDIYCTFFNEEIVTRYVDDKTEKPLVTFDGTYEEWSQNRFYNERSNPELMGLKMVFSKGKKPESLYVHSIYNYDDKGNPTLTPIDKIGKYAISLLGIKRLVFGEGLKEIYKTSNFFKIDTLKEIILPNSLQSLSLSTSYLDNKTDVIHNIKHSYYKGGYYIGNEENPFMCLAKIDGNEKIIEMHNDAKIINLSYNDDVKIKGKIFIVLNDFININKVPGIYPNNNKIIYISSKRRPKELTTYAQKNSITLYKNEWHYDNGKIVVDVTYKYIEAKGCFNYYNSKGLLIN